MDDPCCFPKYLATAPAPSGRNANKHLSLLRAFASSDPPRHPVTPGRWYVASMAVAGA
jgi:hypothetical protein